MSDVVKLIGQYGFPIVTTIGVSFVIWYVWDWVTNKIKPVINEEHDALISLVDRIRVLDNDLIRMHQKVDVVLQFKQHL